MGISVDGSLLFSAMQITLVDELTRAQIAFSRKGLKYGPPSAISRMKTGR